MELQFQNQACRCLQQAAWENKSTEQTLEIRLPDNFPDVGRVLGAWGQPLIRGKEWRSDHASVTGGVMCWVLYDAEDGSGVRCVEGWMPFQLRWDLKDSQRDGTIIARCLLRSMDARLTGAGKLMVRAVISANAEALESAEYSLYSPGEIPEDVQVLKNSYPVCIPVEAGEKAVALDEDLVLPPGNADVEKLLFFRLTPTVTEKKLMADKLVFRGAAQLHALYLGVDGKLHVYDTDIPISQYSQLEREYGPDGQLRLEPVVTEMEMEKLDDGRLRLKAGVIGQYVICDNRMIELTQDAYSPTRNVELQTQTLQLPLILEQTSQNTFVEQNVAAPSGRAVDCWVQAAQPRVRQTEQTALLETEGAVQLLYYDGEGKLQCEVSSWEQQSELAASPDCRVLSCLAGLSAPVVSSVGEELSVQAELELAVRTVDANGLSMVTGLTLGEAGEPDPQRPSLILRRAGELSLWETAKRCGSTVEAIRAANNLEAEPEPGRMLLIPVS